MKRILYIGNNFTPKSKYNSTLTTLSNLLKSEGFTIDIVSDKQNQIIRLFHMCYSVVKHRKVDFMLVDTFSTSGFYFAFFTSQIARFFKIKYIPILHGGNLPNRIKKSTKFSKMIFDNSFNNVAPSNYLKSAFEKEGYQVSFIPNTIEIDNYKFKMRKTFSPKILWVRAFHETYNPTMAIEVIKRLKPDFPDCMLTMVGPVKDNSLDVCKDLVAVYELEKNVNFTGVLAQEKWHKLSEDFDIFINTTNFDNTPLSVIESMALGLPIISTNVGGLNFLIDDGVDGQLLEKNDVDAMADKIKFSINNPDVIREIVIAARHKVEQFDWKKVRNKWFEVLK